MTTTNTLIYPTLNSSVHVPLFTPLCFLMRTPQSLVPGTDTDGTIHNEIWTNLPHTRSYTNGSSSSSSSSFSPNPSEWNALPLLPIGDKQSIVTSAALVFPIVSGTFEATARVIRYPVVSSTDIPSSVNHWIWLGEFGKNIQITVPANNPHNLHKLIPTNPSPSFMNTITEGMSISARAMCLGSSRSHGNNSNNPLSTSDPLLNDDGFTDSTINKDLVSSILPSASSSVRGEQTQHIHANTSPERPTNTSSSSSNNYITTNSTSTELKIPVLHALLLDNAIESYGSTLVTNSSSTSSSNGSTPMRSSSSTHNIDESPSTSSSSSSSSTSSSSNPLLSPSRSSSSRLQGLSAGTVFQPDTVAHHSEHLQVPRSNSHPSFASSDNCFSEFVANAGEIAYVVGLLASVINHTMENTPHQSPAHFTALVQMLTVLPTFRSASFRGKLLTKLLGIENSTAHGLLEDIGKLPLEIIASAGSRICRRTNTDLDSNANDSANTRNLYPQPILYTHDNTRSRSSTMNQDCGGYRCSTATDSECSSVSSSRRNSVSDITSTESDYDDNDGFTTNDNSDNENTVSGTQKLSSLLANLNSSSSSHRKRSKKMLKIKYIFGDIDDVGDLGTGSSSASLSSSSSSLRSDDTPNMNNHRLSRTNPSSTNKPTHILDFSDDERENSDRTTNISTSATSASPGLKRLSTPVPQHLHNFAVPQPTVTIDESKTVEHRIASSPALVSHSSLLSIGVTSVPLSSSVSLLSPQVFFGPTMTVRQRVLLTLARWASGNHWETGDMVQPIVLDIFLNALQHLSPAYIHGQLIMHILQALCCSNPASLVRVYYSRALRVLFGKGVPTASRVTLHRGSGASRRKVPNLARSVVVSVHDIITTHISDSAVAQYRSRIQELPPISPSNAYRTNLPELAMATASTPATPSSKHRGISPSAVPSNVHWPDDKQQRNPFLYRSNSTSSFNLEASPNHRKGYIGNHSNGHTASYSASSSFSHITKNDTELPYEKGSNGKSSYLLLDPSDVRRLETSKGDTEFDLQVLMALIGDLLHESKAANSSRKSRENIKLSSGKSSKNLSVSPSSSGNTGEDDTRKALSRAVASGADLTGINPTGLATTKDASGCDSVLSCAGCGGNCALRKSTLTHAATDDESEERARGESLRGIVLSPQANTPELWHALQNTTPNSTGRHGHGNGNGSPEAFDSRSPHGSVPYTKHADTSNEHIQQSSGQLDPPVNGNLTVSLTPPPTIQFPSRKETHNSFNDTSIDPNSKVLRLSSPFGVRKGFGSSGSNAASSIRAICPSADDGRGAGLGLWIDVARAVATAAIKLSSVPDGDDGVTAAYKGVLSCALQLCHACPLLREVVIRRILRKWPTGISENEVALLEFLATLLSHVTHRGDLSMTELREILLIRICKCLTSLHIKVARNALVLVDPTRHLIDLLVDDPDSLKLLLLTLNSNADHHWNPLVRKASAAAASVYSGHFDPNNLLMLNSGIDTGVHPSPSVVRNGSTTNNNNATVNPLTNGNPYSPRQPEKLSGSAAVPDPVHAVPPVVTRHSTINKTRVPVTIPTNAEEEYSLATVARVGIAYD